MARITVAELKEALDDYGDHLEVAIRTNYGNDDEKVIFDFEVDDTQEDGSIIVVLDIETR